MVSQTLQALWGFHHAFTVSLGLSHLHGKLYLAHCPLRKDSHTTAGTTSTLTVMSSRLGSSGRFRITVLATSLCPWLFIAESPSGCSKSSHNCVKHVQHVPDSADANASMAAGAMRTGAMFNSLRHGSDGNACMGCTAALVSSLSLMESSTRREQRRRAWGARSLGG